MHERKLSANIEEGDTNHRKNQIAINMRKYREIKTTKDLKK